MDSPFTKHVALMTLKAASQVENNPYTKMLQPSKEPWALRLTTGEPCWFETGATDAINGYAAKLPMRPADSGSSASPIARPATWHAYKSVFPKNRKLTTVTVAVAVF